jgi:hypothetical protein
MGAFATANRSFCDVFGMFWVDFECIDSIVLEPTTETMESEHFYLTGIRRRGA